MGYIEDKDRVIIEVLSRSNKKELASLNQLLGKYCPHLPMLKEGFSFEGFRKGTIEDYKRIQTLGKKYYGEKLGIVWRDLTEDRWKMKYHNKSMPNLPKRDNKKTYIGGGGSNRNMIRYPSLKRSKSTWRKFYALFPSAERRKDI